MARNDPRVQRILTTLGVTFVAMLLAVTPGFGYTIYLNDGSKLIAREAPVIKGDTALIILQNGATSSIAASEINVSRTNEANKSDYGTALILERGKVTEDTKTQPKQDSRLSDLINKGSVGQRSRPTAQRTIAASTTSTDDLKTMPRTAYRGNLDVSREIQNVFRGQGVDELGMYQGTKADRVLIRVSTNSESAVFRTLKAAAGALRHVRGLYPDDIAAFELVMATSNGGRAGQFLLSPELAETLLAEGTDVSAFFVENVQF